MSGEGPPRDANCAPSGGSVVAQAASVGVPRIPGGVWMLGFVSLLMDLSLIHI